MIKPFMLQKKTVEFKSDLLIVQMKFKYHIYKLLYLMLECKFVCLSVN